MYVLLIVFCPFVLFLLAIVLSVLLRYTDTDCPFGIFKPFFFNAHRIYKCKLVIVVGMLQIHYSPLQQKANPNEQTSLLARVMINVSKQWH